MTRVILASASPRRRELLAALIDDFEVIAADVPEPLTDDAVTDAQELAMSKAAHVAASNLDAVVIGADTIVFDDVGSYGKPADAADAFRMWQALGGRMHRVVTGLAVVSGNAQAGAVSVSEVELAELDAESVAAYIASSRPMDKAGAYAIQDEDVPTVTRLSGCYCAVMGLPLWDVKRLLEARGVGCRNPAATFERCDTTCTSRDGATK